MTGSIEDDSPYDDEEEESRYDESPEYRLEYGPSIERYQFSGYGESLVGLEISFEFGTLQGFASNIKSVGKAIAVHDNDTLKVEWTGSSGDDGAKKTKKKKARSFTGQLNNDLFLKLYFHNRTDQPDGMLSDDEQAFSPCFFLGDANFSAKLCNFHIPESYVMMEYFPWMEDYDFAMTKYCLNDPANARHYDPTGTEALPIWFFLTLLVLCKQYDPSVTLPMIITPELEKVYKMADTITRLLVGRGEGRSKWNDSLEALFTIVKRLETLVDDMNHSWKAAYDYAHALLLSLSDAYEENIPDAWHFARDPGAVSEVSERIVLAWGRIFLSETANRKFSEDEKSHIGKLLHGVINVGSFAEEDSPEAGQVWKQLLDKFPRK